MNPNHHRRNNVNESRSKQCQRTTPCPECPFNRKVAPGTLGGSPVQTYVGQAVLPFWLPCHMSPGYKGKVSDPTTTQQCAGAAIFRNNIGVAAKMPAAILSLPPDRELSFSSLAEFVAHHLQVSVAAVERNLTDEEIRWCAMREASNVNVREVKTTNQRWK